MTPGQIRMALALNACVFVPGIGVKRFARSMANMAAHRPDYELTDKQSDYLKSAVIKFRRQIDHDVVELAEGE